MLLRAQSHYQHLDARYFPEVVELYRFDQDARVTQSIKTARTILAEQEGTVAGFRFKDKDVASHIFSTYESRLQNPHDTTSAAGSPFISASLKMSKMMISQMSKRGELGLSSLYRLTVPRLSVIVPVVFRNYNEPVSQQDALEVLIIGDVELSAIERIGPATFYHKPVRKFTSISSNSKPPLSPKLFG